MPRAGPTFVCDGQIDAGRWCGVDKIKRPSAARMRGAKMGELIAVRDKAGAVVLYDMFIDGVWHGSRRTLEQCGRYLKALGLP